MHSKLVLFLFVIPFTINPFSSFSQETDFQNSDFKFELQMGYMLPFHQIDQQQFHFGTNAPYSVGEETNSKSTFSLGLLYTKKLSTSAYLLAGVMNYYGDYQITFNYFERGSNEAERKFVHDIQIFSPLSPLFGFSFKPSTTSGSSNFSISTGVGFKPLSFIEDKRTHIVEANNFEREGESDLEDKSFFYPFLGLEYDMKNTTIGVSYLYKLYNFVYKQGSTYFVEGKIFDAEVSTIKLSFTIKL